MAGLRAAEAGEAEERVLISTSDIPFLTPESVEDFVRGRVANPARTCAAPLCRWRSATQRFPEMKRTAIKLREGPVHAGKSDAGQPAGFLLAHQDTIQRAYAARKSPRPDGPAARARPAGAAAPGADHCRPLC